MTSRPPAFPPIHYPAGWPLHAWLEDAADRTGGRIALRFEGQGVDERAVVAAITGDHAPALKVGDVIVRVDPHYFRPAEVETLLGDPGQAKKDLGWVPQITLDEMVKEMVDHDLEQARQLALLQKHGFAVQVSKEK